MALWANTADGWGSDASKNGNGALGTYLQSSLSSAPKSPSEKQAGDPTNTMPTSSISRMAQPAVSRAAVTTTPQVTAVTTQANPVASAITGGVIARGGGDPSQDFQQATGAMPAGASVDVSAGASYTPTTQTKDSLAYGGPTYFQRSIDIRPGQRTIEYYQLDPVTRKTTYLGRNTQTDGQPDYFVNAYKTGLNGGQYRESNTTALQNIARSGRTVQFKSDLNFMQAGDSILAQNKDNLDSWTQQNEAIKANNAQAAAELDKYWTDYYRRQIGKTGALPPLDQSGQNRSPNDASIRAAVQAEYNENKAGSDLIGKGVLDVDTSQQDAINQSSIAALASRYSTNISKGDVGSMGRLYASALSAQSGVNHQLSDEAYATGFNRNMTTFTQAVQNQATIDASATGQKLQTDITAMGDVIAKLQQQTKQLATSSGNAINGQLNDLQERITDYKAKADKYGADADEVIKLGKILIGAVVGVTAIALAPVTGGASIAGGAALGAAVIKS